MVDAPVNRTLTAKTVAETCVLNIYPLSLGEFSAYSYILLDCNG